jgi:hypothetical protein
MNKTICFLLMLIWGQSFFWTSQSSAYLLSNYIGGFPGICEDGECYDDGSPLDQSPVNISRNILEHQLRSPTCSTDLIFINFEFPQNTGNPNLDLVLAKDINLRFQKAKSQALNLLCNDFEGCETQCLPVGLESKYYIQQSSQNYLSIFQVDRFIGNFRRNQHLKGTVNYSFKNYDLSQGQLLKINDIFPNSKNSIPLFWAKIDQKLGETKNCLSQNLLVDKRRVSKNRLEASDILLAKDGATIALWTQKAGTCRSQIIDIPSSEMIEIGASPNLWNQEP